MSDAAEMGRHCGRSRAVLFSSSGVCAIVARFQGPIRRKDNAQDGAHLESRRIIYIDPVLAEVLGDGVVQ
jgi:hypothetical protein